MSTRDVIVIGPSSGGVEALKSLVSGFSRDLPAAVFVVLHIGPHPSVLPDILRHVSALPVDHGIDRARIENGRICFAPVQIDCSVKLAEMPRLLLRLADGNSLEKGMNMPPKTFVAGAHFSDLTCPECRGPLREAEPENLEQFECGVGHRYSFASILEKHAITTERVWWPLS